MYEVTFCVEGEDDSTIMCMCVTIRIHLYIYIYTGLCGQGLTVFVEGQDDFGKLFVEERRGKEYKLDRADTIFKPQYEQGKNPNQQCVYVYITHTHTHTLTLAPYMVTKCDSDTGVHVGS
jgi:hypothetical protein